MKKTLKKLSKKQLILIASLSAGFLVVLTIVLCVVFLVDWTTDKQYIARMQTAINNVYLNSQISVDNTIEISQNGQKVSLYEQKYIIENNEKAIFESKEIYLIDGEIVSTVSECYVLNDSYIFMQRVENEQAITYKVEGNIDNFKKIIYDSTERTVIEISDDAVNQRQLIREKKRIQIYAELKNETVKAIIGSNYVNLRLHSIMSKSGQLEHLTIDYNSIDDLTYVTIIKNVNNQGYFTLPDWINKL